MDLDESPVDQAAAADTTKPSGQIRARESQEAAAAIYGAESSPEKKRADRRATPTKMKVTMASSRTDKVSRLHDRPMRPPSQAATATSHLSRPRRCRLQTHSFTTHPSHQSGDQAATPLAADELLERSPDQEQTPPPEAVAGGGQPDAVRDPAGHATGISTATVAGGTCDVCLAAVMKGDQVAECVQCNWWACEPCVENINHLAQLQSLFRTLHGRLVRSRLTAAAYFEDAAEDEEEALEAERERCQLEWEFENGDSSGSENEDIPISDRLLEAEHVAKEVKIEAEFSRSHADDYEAELAAVQAEVDLARAKLDEGMRVECKRIRTERAKLLPCASRAKAPPALRTGDSNAPYAATLPELSGVRCRCLLLLSEHTARSHSPCKRPLGLPM